MTRHVLFVGNSSRYFVSHRIALARALVARGYRVGAILPEPVPEEDRRLIEAAAIAVHGYPYRPAGMNPATELRTLLTLVRLFRRLRPDVVHHLTLKPALYGGIVGRLLAVPNRVHAIMGLGYLFNATEFVPRVARRLLAPVFRHAFGGAGSIVVLQNPDDRERLLASRSIGVGAWPKIEVVPGSGVDPADFDPGLEPGEPPIVVFAGRLTRPKGIAEFVEAASIVKAKHPSARFVVCGGVVEASPVAVPEAQLRTWMDQGAIEWWGHRDDMPEILGRASLVVLPSHYGEGLPRVLLEAAAAARPIVTTDTEGCREIVTNGVNGLLVPPRDADALAVAICRLLAEPELRTRMGKEGRRIVEQMFSLEIVVQRTLKLYDELLPNAAGADKENNARAF